MIVQVN
jgi:hypothetical protein